MNALEQFQIYNNIKQNDNILLNEIKISYSNVWYDRLPKNGMEEITILSVILSERKAVQQSVIGVFKQYFCGRFYYLVFEPVPYIESNNLPD